MAAYFIDSSALAKIYHPELGTSRLDQILDEPGRRIIISRLTVVELRSVFAIKARTGVLAKADAFSSLSRFDQDQASGIFDVIAFRESDFRQAERLMEMYAFDLRLRTLDALQLAVAVNFREHSRLDYFVAADKALCEVAFLERFAVINPEYP